jgi:lysophospholipase L1-like esterase
VLLTEVAVRLLGLAPTVYRLRPGDERSAYRLSSNPLLGYVLKESYRDDLEPDLHGSFPRTNSHGQRDVERSFEKPAGTRRILMLGDSVVAGHGIRNIDDTISRRLEALLAPDGVEVLNFGVGGYCTAAEVELLAVKGLRYGPDLVVLVFTENDYLDRNEQIVGIRPERPRWAERLFVHSHLFRSAALALDLYGFREATDAEVYVREHEAAVGEHNTPRGLERLAGLAGNHGFAVAIAVWPAFAGHEVVDRHVTAERPDRLMVEILAEEVGIPCFRLSPYFREDYRAWRTSAPRAVGPAPVTHRYTIGDGMHPSERGAETAARALKAVLDAQPELLPGE